MIKLPTFDALRDYVRSVLCQEADLELSTPMLEAALIRSGRHCGLEFILVGPRSVRLSSIWDALGGKILFYDQDLVRFLVTAVEGPNPTDIADRPREELQTASVWKGK